MFNAFVQSTSPISVPFDPIGETNRDKITEMAESMLPGAKKWLSDAGVPIPIVLPSGAALKNGLYEGGDYFFKLKFTWQPMAATFTIDELKVQAPLWKWFTEWSLKPTPNAYATVTNRDAVVTGVKTGLTTLKLDVCIPLLTKRTDENGLLVPGASIRGHKFLDKNANGVSEPEEPGLAGWRIELNGGQDYRITYKDGTYLFNDLPPGTYTVSEVQQPGWAATTPTSATVQVQRGEVHNVHFGNRLLTGEIQGFKFNDLNRNGQLDEGEPFLDGWEIQLVDPARSATTSAAGWFSFGNLTPRQYTVREVLRPGWYNTTPTSQTVTVNAESVTFVYFGNTQAGPDRGVIYGTKFEDMNGNAKWDTGEPPLPGWSIVLSGAASRTAVTDDNGEYRFADLASATYFVDEVIPSGWTRTTFTLPSIPLSAGMQLQLNFGNFRSMKVRGRKFEDRNQNGVQDLDERGLPGWTIELDLHQDGKVDYTAVTDANGDYAFEDVGPGEYNLARTFTIQEVPQKGWLQTWPQAVESYPIHSGLNVSGANFENVRTCKLCGAKFEDLDGDGTWGMGEPGLAGWRVFLDLKNDGVSDKEALTDQAGNVCFDDVPPGTHSLTEESRKGWLKTRPSGLDDLIVKVEADGISPSPQPFGNFHLIKLCGAKFHDLNGNRKRDAGEPGLAGWTVRLDLDGDGDIEKTTVTDASGGYCFEEVGPGTHKLSEVVQNGWTQTFPNKPAEHVVTAKSGEDKTDLNFGNFKLMTISGRKFNDLNNNGVKEEDEPGLQGWTIFQDQNQDVALNNPASGDGVCDVGATEPCRVTDDKGDYIFAGVGPGVYRIREVLQAGWKQTTPDPSDLVAVSGRSFQDIDFGNYRTVAGGQISGQKFYDLDQDGVKEAREPGLPGFTVFLDTNNNGVLDSGEKSAVTDDDGKYASTGLAAGAYTVREVQKEGWRHTLPAAGFYALVLATDQKLIDRDFGDYILSPTHLYFPFYRGDASTFTGFAVSTRSSQPVVGLWTAYGENGQLLDFPRNPSAFRLNPKGQLARLGQELFGIPGTTPQAGWVQLMCDSPEVGTFFQHGNYTLQEMDGAVAFSETGKTLYFTRALAWEGVSTHLSIANPGSSEVALNLKFVPDWGDEAADSEAARTIPPKGVLYESTASLFGAAFADTGYVVAEVARGGGVVGFELIRQEAPQTVVGLNAQFAGASTEAFSSHLANGPTLMTLFKFINVSSQTRDIDVTAYDEAGRVLGESEFSLLPGEALEKDAGNLFDLGFDTLTVGSVRVKTSGVGVIGDVVFGEPYLFTFLAALPLQTKGFTEASFDHLANGAGFFTGIGLYNPNSEAAQVTVETVSPSGNQTGQAGFSMAAGTRQSKLAPELVPSSLGQVGGYVVIRSTQPLIAQQLFGDFGLRLLSAVPPTVVK
jgi:protocatechuate 3,4-dioxygenase beta subunit/uncharacterized protein (DUF2141 family)